MAKKREPDEQESDEHGWWTPEHPEDGFSWTDPNAPRPPRNDGRRRRIPRPRRRGRADAATVAGQADHSENGSAPQESEGIALRQVIGPAAADTAPRPARRRRPAGLKRPSAATISHRRLAALGGVLLLLIVIVVITQSGGGPAPVTGPPLPGLGRPARSGNPFAYSAAHQADFVKRAAEGAAQPLFDKSPGGVLATAARVARFRSDIEAAVKGTAIDPNLLEGLVFLESSGDPQIIAGTDPANASGLTQILATTGQSLLGMHINLTASRNDTGKIEAAGGPDAGTAAVARLERKRAAVDDRFVPAKALAATVRYLQIAAKDFGGRMDLAFESYHMGIGNLQSVLRDYDGGKPVPYAQVYFDSTPDHNAQTYALLRTFSDDSSTYLWRLYAAASIMHLYRTDRSGLTRLNHLETNFPSIAQVLVPPDRYPGYTDPQALSAAYHSRQLLPLPRNGAALGLAFESSMGSRAHKLKVPAALYRGLRPAALDLLIELAARVQAISGSRAPLTVASSVIDARYQALIGNDDPPALTGYTFQILRQYGSSAQRDAFQSMLDLLQSLNVIGWIRGTHTIEITVAPDADQVIANGV